jgi:hypothetical protein
MSRVDFRADSLDYLGGMMRALLGGHGGVNPRQIGFYLVAIAEVEGDDDINVLKREGLVTTLPETSGSL